jgi:hypothetical protein
VLDGEETVDQSLQKAARAKNHQLLVRLSPSGWSIVTRQELESMSSQGKGAANLGSLLPILQVPHLHPDYPLETALRYVDRWPLVPVVSRADFRQLEGVVSERNVLARYREFGEG